MVKSWLSIIGAAFFLFIFIKGAVLNEFFKENDPPGPCSKSQAGF
jgi:hypothetical protein